MKCNENTQKALVENNLSKLSYLLVLQVNNGVRTIMSHHVADKSRGLQYLLDKFTIYHTNEPVIKYHHEDHDHSPLTQWSEA